MSHLFIIKRLASWRSIPFRAVALASAIWVFTTTDSLVALAHLNLEDTSLEAQENDSEPFVLPAMRTPNAREQAFAERLLTAIEKSDEHGLLSLLESPLFFSDDGVTLHQEFYDMAFGRDTYEDRGYKTMWDIYSQGKLKLLVEDMPNDTIFLYFIPEIYEDQTQSLAFFMFEWMRKYFACRLDDVNGALKIEINFCFAETEGPMPDPNMYD